VKTCTGCHLSKPLDAFHVDNKASDGRQSRCKACVLAHGRKVRQANPAAHRRHVKDTTIRLRRKVFAAYGGKCTCCGEPRERFLTLDHTYNDGAEHRRQLNARGYEIYRAAVKENFPGRYTVLCYNCNFGKAFNGGVCPHQEELADDRRAHPSPRPQIAA